MKEKSFSLKNEGQGMKGNVFSSKNEWRFPLTGKSERGVKGEGESFSSRRKDKYKKRVKKKLKEVKVLWMVKGVITLSSSNGKDKQTLCERQISKKKARIWNES